MIKLSSVSSAYSTPKKGVQPHREFGFAVPKDNLKFHIEMNVENMMKTAVCLKQLSVDHDRGDDVQKSGKGRIWVEC